MIRPLLVIAVINHYTGALHVPKMFPNLLRKEYYIVVRVPASTADSSSAINKTRCIDVNLPGVAQDIKFDRNLTVI